jgi:large subunit ribosomal protein L15
LPLLFFFFFSSKMLARGAVRHAGVCVPTVPLRQRSKYTLPSPYTVKLGNLRPAPGSHIKKVIKGRGIGSGLGKTSGKGHKGQWSHSAPPDWFEGGQTPLYRRVRKFGFKNRFRRPLVSLNLGTVQGWFDRGLFKEGDTITMHDMWQKQLLTSIKHGVKLLARGKDVFTAPLKLEVTAVSEAARKALEGAGGSVKTVFFNKLGIRTYTRKEAKDISISFAAAPPKKAKKYDVPKFELPLPAAPPKGISYARWQSLLQKSAGGAAPFSSPSDSSSASPVSEQQKQGV